MPDVERFSGAFSGLTRAYGTFAIDQKKKNGTKVKGRARTVHGELTRESWEAHLEGRVGLGVVPIRNDGTCLFAAIDVDVYDLDLEVEERKIQDLGLPLVPCRTKSGGAHLYLFLSEPVQASVVREKLVEWSFSLGHTGAEIFPKQDQLRSRDDAGSWINLPYFGGDRTVRYAVRDGKALGLAGFLDLVDEVRIEASALKKLTVVQNDEWAEAPPCLARIAKVGVSEGGRNEIMFAMGVFAKKLGGDWVSLLEKWNAEFFDPPLEPIELAAVVKSLERKEYAYTCSHAALAAVCDRALCFKRKHGVGGASRDPGVELTDLLKILTDPPTWIIKVNGEEVRLDSTEDLLSQAKFNRIVVERLNLLPNVIRPQAWGQIIRELLDTVKEAEAPEDAGRVGQFRNLVDYFVTERPRARNREELMIGKCLIEDGIAWFRSGDLLKFLEQSKFKNASAKEAWSMLRDSGAETRRIKVKGKVIRCWGITADSREEDGREEEGEMF